VEVGGGWDVREWVREGEWVRGGGDGYVREDEWVGGTYRT
jgi:hypothetical protein